ncbi:MAG: phosphoenolpyruvate carboxykinase (ATP) [Anaerovoracaceae bacterium]|jgi:phosphoenolpyruvate carboxykinase (ATP)
MSTNSNFTKEEIRIGNKAFTPTRTTIETAFYGNNVKTVRGLSEAYEMAKSSPGTITIDQPVFQPEKIGIPKDAKVLLFNDGETVGRFAGARIILGEKGVVESDYALLLREAVYRTRYKTMLHTQAYIGLHEDFMVKANLLVPETYENTLYNWLLNFQYMNDFYNEMYAGSKRIGDEPDILIFSDPDWKDDAYPNGLAFFNPEHNCAALLGLRYFGEHKKGTLTLAWGIANRNGYVSCHGGMKRMIRKDGRKYLMAGFGLSGSGKSTITHARHGGKYDVTILHDDAYVISVKDGSSVALEPSYFDKTQDYPPTAPDNKYLITAQNCGATVDSQGNLVLVTEDIRNGNGRAIKSKLWAENRVDKFDEPIDTIVWLMKDHTLPPVLKINDPITASVMGACLATKRTTAEKLLADVDQDALVFEPYANPFRTYALEQDYYKFKALFEDRGVNCYIINTGHFLEKKIPKEITIEIIESIVDEKAEFIPFGPFANMEYMTVEGFVPALGDKEYIGRVKKSMESRLDYLISLREYKGGRDLLPQEAFDVLEALK